MCFYSESAKSDRYSMRQADESSLTKNNARTNVIKFSSFNRIANMRSFPPFGGLLVLHLSLVFLRAEW